MAMRRPDSVLVVTLAICLSCAIGCYDLCGNEVCQEYPSPGRGKRLVVFQRDCGATTYWSVQAQVLDAGEGLPNDSGHSLMSKGACLGRDAELPSVGVRWTGEQDVLVTYPGLRPSQVTMNGVRVTTATGPPE